MTIRQLLSIVVSTLRSLVSFVRDSLEAAFYNFPDETVEQAFREALKED